MPTPLSLLFRTVRLTRWDGDAVVAPLLHPTVLRLDADPDEFAARFRDAVEKRHCEPGDHVALLQLAAPLKPAPLPLELTWPAAKDGHSYPEMALRFDALTSPAPSGGWLGFVPVLGIEAFARDKDDLSKRLHDAVRLEFARRKRATSLHSILATQWIERLELVETPVELPSYSLAELEELRSRNFKRLLPEIATELPAGERRVFEMDEPLDQVVRALSGRFARSVVIVGPSGVGKSALVEEFARTKARHRELAPKKLWEITAGRLLQKLTREAGWQENLARVCRELRESGDLLFIRNLADLFEVGQYIGNSVSIAEALRVHLERGDVRIVTECTPEEAARIDLRAPGYLALFQQVRLEPPSAPATERIIRLRVAAVAKPLDVAVEPDAVDEAIRLHRRYSPYSGFPGKAIRFLEACILSRRQEEGDRTLTRRLVTRRYCEEAGLPEFMVDPDRPLPVDDLERHFKGGVFGQEEATSTVIDLLAAVKTGLARPGKPIASLLFIGPTGVGKTELAKVLAEFMFSSRARLTRFDMSEYADLAGVMRLTGEGREEGLLSGAVRREPFSVLLFDEVEKAHPVFFDLLLQVLGEGRLTDARGRTADFCSTLAIMTSNLGAQELPKAAIGFGGEGDRRRRVVEHFLRTVEAHFRPELFNRLDRVVAFAPLDRATVRRIVDREMRLVRARPGLRWRDVSLRVDEAALDLLCDRGYDSVYGARQLQRAIRDELLLPLARQLNRYEVATPVEASVSADGGTLDVRAKGLVKKPALDRIVAAGRTLRAVVGDISARRRATRGILDGAVHMKLVSERDLLERQRRKTKPRKWEASLEAGRLRLLEKLAADAAGTGSEIEWLEAEAVLALVDPERAAANDLHELHEEHRRSSWAVMLRLYDVFSPQARKAVVGVYGGSKHLAWLQFVYATAAQELGFKRTAFSIWLVPEKADYEATPFGKEHRHKEAKRVGLEMVIEGPAAQVAFGDEGGLWEIRDREGERHSVVVSTGAARPRDAHRRSYFEKRIARRFTAPDLIRDRLYASWDAPFHETDTVGWLTRTLRARLEEGVMSALKGT
jgi:ATP-dependent Clp protease ATP-binding subunit ClpA